MHWQLKSDKYTKLAYVVHTFVTFKNTVITWSAHVFFFLVLSLGGVVFEVLKNLKNINKQQP